MTHPPGPTPERWTSTKEDLPRCSRISDVAAPAGAENSRPTSPPKAFPRPFPKDFPRVRGCSRSHIGAKSFRPQPRPHRGASIPTAVTGDFFPVSQSPSFPSFPLFGSPSFPVSLFSNLPVSQSLSFPPSDFPISLSAGHAVDRTRDHAGDFGAVGIGESAGELNDVRRRQPGNHQPHHARVGARFHA